MYAAFIKSAENIVWVTGICLIAIGIGRLVLIRTRMKGSDAGEALIFDAAVGFAVIGYGIFILGICQALYPVIIYSFTAVCAILALAGLLAARRPQSKAPLLPQTDSCKTPAPNRRLVVVINRCCFILLAISLLACAALVLTPEIGQDALTYHIGVPKMFLEHHGIYSIPGNIFANYPFFGEMLYIWGVSLWGEILPKGTHFAIAGFILFSMWKFGKRYVHENSFDFLPLLLFFTIPSVFINAHVAYCDLILTFYVFVSLYAFVNWFHTEDTLWLILCALFSGISMSTKYGGLSFPFIGTLGVLWVCKKMGISSRKAVHLLFVYILFSFITGAPFYLKNWIVTGNPLYPFFYQIFGGKGWSLQQAGYYDVFIKSLGMGRDLLDYLLLPWNLSFRARMNSPFFDGIIGPAFILILPFAIGMRKVSIEIKILLVYCLLAFIFWASSAQQIRYLMPIFPFLAIIASLTFSYYRNKKAIFTLLCVFITTGLLYNGYYIVTDFRKIRPLSVLMGQEDEDAFLTRMIPSYAILKYVNTSLPEKSYIFTIYMKNLSYLFNRPFYSDSMFESYTIESILKKSKTPEDVRLALKKRGFTHILYDIHFVFGDGSTFSQENKRAFSGISK